MRLDRAVSHSAKSSAVGVASLATKDLVLSTSGTAAVSIITINMMTAAAMCGAPWRCAA